MATTTNFGWTTPDDTSLVKDGAAAIRSLGQAIDTSMMDLEGGTTGQALIKNSNTDMDFVWSTIASGASDWTLLNAGGTALTGAATITVSGLAAKELLVLVAGASSASAGSLIYMRINGDSSNNYSNFGIENSVNTSYAATTLSSTGSYSGQSLIYVGTMASNAAATVSGSVFIDLADKTGWKRYQTVGSGNAGGGGGNDWGQYITQGFYEASAAVTSISLISQTGNFDAGTVYVLGAN
jgi:hypothetical protein